MDEKTPQNANNPMENNAQTFTLPPRDSLLPPGVGEDEGQLASSPGGAEGRGQGQKAHAPTS